MVRTAPPRIGSSRRRGAAIGIIPLRLITIDVILHRFRIVALTSLSIRRDRSAAIFAWQPAGTSFLCRCQDDGSTEKKHEHH
jgi:hypothetical protein